MEKLNIVLLRYFLVIAFCLIILFTSTGFLLLDRVSRLQGINGKLEIKIEQLERSIAQCLHDQKEINGRLSFDGPQVTDDVILESKNMQAILRCRGLLPEWVKQ